MPNFASLVLKSTQLEQVGNLLVTMAPRAAVAMLETYRGIPTMLGIRRREGSLAMRGT